MTTKATTARRAWLVAAALAWTPLGGAGCVTGQGDATGGGDAAPPTRTPESGASANSSTGGMTSASGTGDGGAPPSDADISGEGAARVGDLGEPASGEAASVYEPTEAAAADVTAPDTSTVVASDGQAPSRDGAADAGCPGLFCEDFEKGTLDPAIWSAQASGGQTLAVQSTVVAHGRHAVQFHANPNVVSYDFIVTRNAPVALRGHHFGRAYFNVTPKPPAAHTEFLFAGSPGFPKLKYLEVAGIGTGWQLTFVNLVAGGESYASGGTRPDARWICLEWEFNDAPDQATVFVDGVQSYARNPISFSGVSTGLVGGFTDFGFGFYAWHPAPYPFDVYYDDIVLDTKRVGCLTSP